MIKGKYGKIDVLFVNAGGAKVASVADTTEDLFDEISDTNFRGAYFTAQKALPLLVDGGTVIFTSSWFDEFGTADISVVSATKAAVRSLARALASELLSRKIRVNAISPGVIATPIFGKLGVSRPQEGKVSHVCKQEKGRPGVEKEKYSGDSLVVTSVIVLVHMALAAQDKFTPQAPSGIGFSEFKGFERWQVVAPSQTDHGINDLTGEG